MTRALEDEDGKVVSEFEQPSGDGSLFLITDEDDSVVESYSIP